MCFQKADIMKIDPNHLQNDVLSSSTSKTVQNKNTDLSPNDSLELSFSLIDDVLTLPQTDTDAVRKAKELLLSGLLESPKNIRQAVESILQFGICLSGRINGILPERL